MSLRTRNTRSNSGLSEERTIDFMKKGWVLLEVEPRDSRFSVGFRLCLPENPDAPILLVHNKAAVSLLKTYAGRNLDTKPRNREDPPYFIRTHRWVPNPTASPRQT